MKNSIKIAMFFMLAFMILSMPHAFAYGNDVVPGQYTPSYWDSFVRGVKDFFTTLVHYTGWPH